MKKHSQSTTFEKELQKRLGENRRLYHDSIFSTFDSREVKFVASILGVNPWRVVVPISFVLSLLLRLLFGVGFSEFVLDLLGGK